LFLCKFDKNIIKNTYGKILINLMGTQTIIITLAQNPQRTLNTQASKPIMYENKNKMPTFIIINIKICYYIYENNYFCTDAKRS
jgi:hypothetical protein